MENLTVPQGFKLNFGINRNEQTICSLIKTHYKINNQFYELSEPNLLNFWDVDGLTQQMIDESIMLNDWSRWNTELFEGQKVQISDNIYYDLLNSLPPKKWDGDYFEVGEPHHHDNKGRAIHRACWTENGLYYTGYPRV